ncbi:putative lipid phosphate phosphatase 3, chloroplastic [Silene latifolia]|uniref:putative lipid phosphate phosphatase 3, chloroplastic n=1 Tax=Silene latifolia TaxID=37657 RepID=UPI003D76ABB5
MTESEVRAYTVFSHGAPLARKHLYDWLILLILVGIQVVLNILDPFKRFVGKDMMVDLKYPFHPNTIPFWTVYVYCILLPMIIFLIRYLRRKDVHDLHHAILGLLYSMVITGIITDAIKNGVGRPRPNFFNRCFPDGIDFYDQTGNVICYGEPKDIREGYKSFPSGHTSLSFAGLGFLSLYLTAKIQAFDRNGHVGKLCVVFLPLLAAALVGVSRVDDYWHHWTDVFVGGLLGLTVSFFCYLQFFALPHHTKGWGPYSYFKALERELQTNGQSEIQAGQEMISPQHVTSAQSRSEDHSVTIQ